jgi:steroid delta-isomerase-like uncharacterized protein
MGTARTITDRAYAAMAAHDAEAFLALCSSTCEFTEAGMRMEGHEQLRGMVQAYFTAFPDMRVDVIDAVEGDGVVAAETRFTGTHTGPLLMPSGELPPTGRAVSIDTCDYIKLSGDRIQSWHVYMDSADFMAQLGVTPAPAEAAAVG